MSGKKRQSSGAVKTIPGFCVLVLLLCPPLHADTFTYSGDSASTVLAEGSQHALLTGNARVDTQDLRITADSIELFGKDFIYAQCHGNVRVVDAKRGLDLTSQELFYDRDQKIARIRGNAVMADLKNEMVVKGGFIEDRDLEKITIVQIGVRIFKKDIDVQGGIREVLAGQENPRALRACPGFPKGVTCTRRRGSRSISILRTSVSRETCKARSRPNEGAGEGRRPRRSDASASAPTAAPGRRASQAAPAAAWSADPSPPAGPRARLDTAATSPPASGPAPRHDERASRWPVTGPFFWRGWQRAYGRSQAVRDVTFTMESGEVVGLLGPNGAGKTTVFYMVVGFIKPTSGRIWLNGKDVSGLPMYKRARMGVSYLPQEPSVFRKLSVEDNIDAIIETRQQPHRARRNSSVLDQLLDDLGIAHLRKQKAYTLSGGERRRTEIARSLAIEPKFLLLDEPFRGHRPHHRLRAQGHRPGAVHPRHRGAHHRPQRARHPADHPPLPHHQPGGDPGERLARGAPGERAGPKDLPGPRVPDIGLPRYGSARVRARPEGRTRSASTPYSAELGGRRFEETAGALGMIST